MSAPCSNFQSIFDAALSDYAKQTDIDLVTYPFAQTLQNCHTTDAILDLLQERAEQFQAYRNGNRKLINCLKPVVQVLHTVSGILGEAVPFQPAKAIIVGIDVLLSAAIGVSTSYDALVDLFDCIENFLNRLRIYTEIPFSPSMTGMITKIMAEVLSVLSLATKQIKQGRLKKFAKKLLGESEIEDVLQRLDRLTVDEARMTGTETLQVVHSLVTNMKFFMGDGMTSMDDIWQALVTIQDTTSEINKMKRSQLQQDMRNWLSPPDPSKNHNIARGAHHGRTAEWFTHGSTFEEWKTTGCLLWIHGKPGSGKSILCSSVIQEVKIKCDRGLALMAYYYFDYKDIAKQGISGLLTSLLSQFGTKSNPYYELLSDLYSENYAGSQQPDNEVLIESLKAMLRLPQQPMKFIILDAIDECPTTSGFPTAREEVLDFLEELVGLNLPNLRICVTSRPEVDIRAALEPLTSVHLSIHDEAGQKQDILDYISTVVHTDRRMRRWRPEDRQLVIDALSAKADGMFRWVYCQLDTLRRHLPTMICQALDELPDTLDETYERTLLGIEKEKREFAHRLFQCLTVAIRPLHVDELAELLAIRFDAGQLPRYHTHWRSDNAQEDVLSVCSSLIAVVNVDGSPVVQFSHFSVKEFLTSDRLANSENLSRYHVIPHSAHTILAQASLSVLLHLGDRVDRSSIKNFPFSRYAAQHWVDHGRFENVSSSIQDMMERLFDLEEPSFATWIWIYDMDYPFRDHMLEAYPIRPEALPLYYAARCGFRGLVEYLIAAHPGNVNAIGGDYGSALNAALAEGNVEVALLFLERGADPNIADGRGRTSLYLASRSGRRHDVELLLCRGAAVDSRNNTGWTPLMITSAYGHLDIARLLIQCGAAVDSTDDNGWTPLMFTLQAGHPDITRLLIQSGAAVDSREDDGWTPLMITSQYGHPDIARLLIQSGAAVDSSDDEGWTPLMITSQYGHLDIAQLLIQSGAAVDSSDGEGWTPLMITSQYGHLDIARLLIQSGAVVDSRNNTGLTPLMITSRNGHLHIAQELIHHGAAVNAQNTHLSTPLHFALVKGHLNIIQLLINYHADADKRDKDQKTPLHLATADGQIEITRLLLKSGSNSNSQDNSGSTPLHTAARNGHLDVVKLLLDSGVDVNARDGSDQVPLDVAFNSGNRQVTRCLAEHMGVMDPWDGIEVAPSPLYQIKNLGSEAASSSSGSVEDRNTPGRVGETSLLSASGEGNVDVVQSLLDQGADVNERGEWHRTALHLASRKGKLDVAKLLIKFGAHVNWRNKFGWTPLHYASQCGHSEVGGLLLDHGADVNAKGEAFWTPLHVASDSGHAEIARLLVERGADVHARNADGLTPFEIASMARKLDIVRLLSGVTG